MTTLDVSEMSAVFEDDDSEAKRFMAKRMRRWLQLPRWALQTALEKYESTHGEVSGGDFDLLSTTD